MQLNLRIYSYDCLSHHPVLPALLRSSNCFPTCIYLTFTWQPKWYFKKDESASISHPFKSLQWLSLIQRIKPQCILWCTRLDILCPVVLPQWGPHSTCSRCVSWSGTGQAKFTAGVPSAETTLLLYLCMTGFI